jgi:CubicO group peptidase (beta-lactamase class C family)
MITLVSTPIRDLAADPAALAEALVAHPLVPGAAVAGIVAGAVTIAVRGIEDVETAVALTEDHLLRPGSVTKLLTATAVMRLVEDGRIALDDPIDAYVPSYPGVTVQHLLTHASGLDAGDVFVDAGPDDDCRARYLDLIAGADQLFPPGHTASYCNAGMVLLGRMLEVVQGATFEDVLTDAILRPADMTATRFVDGHTLDTGIARTHVNGAAGRRVVDDAICTRGLAPAGGTLACTIGDLARFLTAPLLRPDTDAAMRRLTVPTPGGVVENAGMGLGWLVWRNPFGETTRHSGGYPGHAALVAVDRASDTALAVMTNAAEGAAALTPMLDPQEAVPSDGQPRDLGCYVGAYASHAGTTTVALAGDGSLTASLDAFPGTYPITPVDRSLFTIMGQRFGFFDFADDGSPAYMRFRMRVQRRR